MEKKENKNLKGIIAISVIYFLTSITSLIIGGLAIFDPSIFTSIPGFNIDLNSGIFTSFKIFMILFSIISFILAYFLLKKNNWARIAIIGISILMIIGGIISIIEGSYLSIANLLFNLLIVLYLIMNKKVKESFTKTIKKEKEAPEE